MKTLRIIFVWVLAVLFSGAITPTLMSWDEPAFAAGAGLNYQAFQLTNGIKPPVPTVANGINTSSYTKCAEGTVANISTDWGTGNVMGSANCGGDFVLVHWYGYIKNPTTQTMYFRSFADDGSWLSINNTQVINDWVDKGCGYRSTGSFNFTANTWYAIDYWFYEWGGGACAQLYSSTSMNGSYNIVPSSLFDQNGSTPVSFSGAGTDTSIASTAQRGTSYSDSVTATGTGTITYAVKTGALPPGISLSSGGALSGSPTTNGTYTFTIEATGVDSGTSATTGSLSVQVGDAPVMSGKSLDGALVLGSLITPITLSDSSAVPGATYAIASGSLPAGLSLNTSTGTISGTPTTKQVKNFTVSATNAIGSSTTPTLTLTVGVAPDVSGSAMEQAVTINNAMTTTWFADNNAYPAPTYSIASGTLPAGVSLNSSTGSLSGTPTERGVFLFTISASNSLGSSETPTLNLTVGRKPRLGSTSVSLESAPGSALTPTSIADATAYPDPVYFLPEGNSLPEGVALDSATGIISGTPTTEGIFHFIISGDNAIGGSSTLTNTIVVGYAPVLSSSAQTYYLPYLESIDPVSVGDDNAYPVPEYTLETGSLPAGLTLNRSTGTISGTPNTKQSRTVSVTATNILGSSTSGNLRLIVGSAPDISRKSLSLSVTQGVTAVSKSYADTDAYPAPTYTLVNDSDLPAGVTLNAATGLLSGTPTERGVFEFYVATSNNGFGSSQTDKQTLTVGARPNIVTVSKTIITAPGVAIASTSLADSDAYPAPTYTVSEGESLPSGMYLDATTGILTGSPSQSGTYVFTVRGENSVGGTTTDTITVIAGYAPDVSSTTLNRTVIHDSDIAAIDLGDPTAYPIPSYTVTDYIASDGTVTRGQLPTGLRLNSSTGRISGTPTDKGVHRFTVTATNIFDQVGSTTQTLTITVNKDAFFVDGYSDITDHTFVGASNDTYSSRLEADGYPAPTYSISEGANALPPGLTLNPSTGRITGTATASGTYSFHVHVDNGVGGGATSRLQTIVAATSPAVTFDNITPEAFADVPYSEKPTFGGYPSPTYTVDGTKPPGLNLERDGTLSGTPTGGGTKSFRICAQIYERTACTRTYSFVVHDEPVWNNASDLPVNAEVGEAYSGHVTFRGRIKSTGGWAITGYGTGLPAGLSIDADGNITGTPRATGVFTFKVAATSTSGVTTTSPELTIISRVKPAWTKSVLGSSSTLVNQSFSSYVEASGYPAPRYSISSGRLPAGLSLDSGSGMISGRPTEHGSFTFTVTATNDVGHVDTASLSLVVIREPAPSDLVIPLTALRNVKFADGITVDAYPAPTFAVATGGSLPPGLVLNTTTGAITGTPTTLGSYKFSIVVSGPMYSAYTTPQFSIAIQQAPTVLDKDIVKLASVGTAYEDGVSVEAFPSVLYSISAGVMPTGLTLNNLTGDIKGTPTEPGDYTFTVQAKNSLGTLAIPLTLSVQQPPSKPILTLAPTAIVGETINGYTMSDGFPTPTYFIASGSLPGGVTINKTTGKISGSPTNAGEFTFTVGALSTAGSATSTPFDLTVYEPGANFEVKADIGEDIAGTAVAVQSEGLMPNARYEVVLRSTPQVVASGTTTRAGAILANFTIPNGLEPGWHSVTLTTEAADGSHFEEVAWFEITASGVLETVSDSQPSATEMANALKDDAAFYEDEGINPATQVPEEEVQQKVTEVTSVVASVALVSAAAATTAAVASAAAAASAASAASAAASSAGAAASAGAASSAASSAAGGAASSAGGASSTSSSSSAGTRTASPSSSSSSSSSSGGGSSSGGARGGSSSGGGSSSSGGGSSSSSGSSSDDGSSGPEYGNLEVEHDDFTTDATAWGDGLAWWRIPFMTWLDRHTIRATHATSPISPVVSRVINDGSYLRAMLGTLMGAVYIAAIGIGFFAVQPGADSMALSGNVALLTAIVVLGAFDGLAGILGMTAFSIASFAMYPVTGLGDIRYVLAVYISGFAPIILSTTFRKIRRPATENILDVWERIVDVFMIGFISSLTTLSLIGGISSYAGAEVPLAANAPQIVFLVTGVALVRIGLEEFAARAFSRRLDVINPTEVDGPGTIQQWVSLVFKYGVLVVMIGDMVGWGWWLWTGAFIMFVPGILSMTFSELPKSRLIAQIIPGGLAALLFATLLAGWSGDIVGAIFADSPMYGQLSFLLVPLPVIATAIIGMFSDGSEKWYVEKKLTWVYLIGGIGVFVSTVVATDFFGQVFPAAAP